MELKNYFAQDSQGNIIPGATCYLYQPNTSTLVTGLEDAAGNPMPNPFTGAANGLIQFAAPGGLYDLRVSSGMRQFTLRVQCSDLVGPAGPQGEPGPQGVQGERGPAGEDGVDGVTPNLSIGTVTVGETPSATISGSPEAPVLNLVLQAGPKGDKGDQGDQGLQGDTGATGAVPNLTIGTVTTGDTAAATITGTAEDPVLNLVLPVTQGGSGGGAVAVKEKAQGILEFPATGNMTIDMSLGTTIVVVANSAFSGQLLLDFSSLDSGEAMPFTLMVIANGNAITPVFSTVAYTWLNGSAPEFGPDLTVITGTCINMTGLGVAAIASWKAVG